MNGLKTVSCVNACSKLKFFVVTFWIKDNIFSSVFLRDLEILESNDLDMDCNDAILASIFLFWFVNFEISTDCSFFVSRWIFFSSALILDTICNILWQLLDTFSVKSVHCLSSSVFWFGIWL